MISASRRAVCFLALLGLLLVPGIIGCTPESLDQSLISKVNAASSDRPIWAIQKLGYLGPSMAVDGLAVPLNDREPPLRRGTVWTLGRIQNRRVTEALRMATIHSDSHVRRDVSCFSARRIDDGEPLSALEPPCEGWTPGCLHREA